MGVENSPPLPWLSLNLWLWLMSTNIINEARIYPTVYRNNFGQLRLWSNRCRWTERYLFCFVFICLLGGGLCFFLFVVFCLFGVFFNVFLKNKCLIKLHTFEWFLLSEYLFISRKPFFKDAASALYDSIINLLYDWHVNGLGTVYIVANPFIYLFPLKPWNSMTTAGNENIQYNLLKVHGSPLL